MSYPTIRALLNPEHHPHRRGGIRAENAWKIARAIAAKTGETEDQAYALFVETEHRTPGGRRITQTPAVSS